MTTTGSSFVWYDIATTDLAAAEIFYAAVFGWTIADSGAKDSVYKIASAGSHMAAGLMPVPEGAGDEFQPSWFGYIQVDDVDETAGRVTAAGGAVHRGPMDIPDVGRMAVVADPHGAPFMLFRPSSGEQAPAAPSGMPGHIAWQDLRAGDLDEAWAFYATLFGWRKTEAMDVPEAGTYQMFATATGPESETVGGMMTKSPETPAAHWLYFFNVEAIEDAMARVTDGGGTVTMGPMEVPGGEWVALCLDPQGAAFGMTAPTR